MPSVKAIALVATLCLAPIAAHAAKVQLPVTLSDDDIAAMRGKSVAVTLHEPPSFIAGSPGKATFAMVGAFAMMKAGNDFVKDNGIEDPAVELRRQLGELLQSEYGVQMQPVDDQPTREKKPEKLARLHSSAGYMLSVRNLGWQHMYYTSDWNNYWLAYTAYVQLIETGSGRTVAQTGCGLSTMNTPIKPTMQEMHANGGQLVKDFLAATRWSCLRQLATTILRLPPEKVPAIPSEYADLLAKLQPATAQPATAQPATPAPAVDAGATATPSADMP